MKTYRIGEYFSGAGGMSRGIIDASRSPAISGILRANSQWAVDYDRDACLSYHRNIHENSGIVVDEEDGPRIPGIHVRQTAQMVLRADVRKVNPDLLDGVDGFLFGFPCNDFSSAGLTKGLDGDFGGLYRQGLDLIRSHQPDFFIAENVSGLLHANNYGAFAQIIGELKSCGASGYDVVPHMYRFEEYGIPQTRHRIIIVGIRRDLIPSLPRAFLPPKPSGARMSAKRALEGLVAGDPSFHNNEMKKVSDIVSRRLKAIGPGRNIWDVNDTIDEDLRLHPTGTTISSIYRVLTEDKPAYTVVGNGGGGTHMYHWECRPTTDRERARFQTFDDDFFFVGNPQSVRKQIGMAVPPQGARIIAEAVFKTLAGVWYDGVESNLLKEIDPDLIEKKRAAKARTMEAKKRRAEAKATAAADQASEQAVVQEPLQWDEAA